MVVLIGTLTLIGWALDAPLLKRVVPAVIAMNPASAVAFVLSGLTLWCAARRVLRRLVAIGGAVLVLVGAVRLAGYLLNTEVGLDQVLFPQGIERDAVGPNRMAPNTAFCFMLAGWAILTIDVTGSRGIRPSQCLAVVLGLLALLALLGYVYGVTSLYGVGPYIPMAIHTAGAFLILALGLLFARPEQGLMRLVTGQDAAGVLLRRLLPAVLLVPPILGALQIAGQRLELYEHNIGIALHVVSTVLILAGLVAIVSHSLQHTTDALQESETRLRQLANSIDDVFWLMDIEENRFIYVSPAYERVWSRTQESLQQDSRSWRECIHPDDRAHVDDALDRRMIVGQYDTEYRIVRPDGSIRWVRDRGFPVQEANGRTRRLAGIAADITNQRLLEDELRHAKDAAVRANRAKSDFLASMSHELRTPLNGVIGMTELLLGTELNADQRRYAWLAKSSGDALLSLINDVLDFSKIEAGKLELESIDFDLRYLVERVAGAFASRADAKGLELIATVHPHVCPLVRGDPGRVQQILTNLVNNAIKFTERGEVVVRATLESEDERYVVVRFAISDTGIGIPHERIGDLFASFTQVDASTTRRYGGSGLGLAICRRLVEAMRGQIGVVSEPGRGSTFWLTLPLERQTLMEYVPDQRGDLRDLRILIADDNATNREVLREQLAQWSRCIETANDGEGALKALRRGNASLTQFDLAILDMQMPGLDGRMLAKEIRADARLRDVVLILLTSAHDVSETDSLKADGFSAVLVKPVRQTALLQTIADSLACASAPPITDWEHAIDPVEESRRACMIGARILLAEDHEVSQEVAATMLSRAGYPCTVVKNGREALEAVLKESFDLILMDCQMPEMDGFEATRAIRLAEQEGRVKKRCAGPLPIVALTANAVKGDRERCVEAGMTDYTSKPLVFDRLVDIIESHLGQAAPESPSPKTQSGGNVSDGDAPPPIDLEQLLTQWGGSRDFAGQFLPKFVSQLERELAQLEEARTGGDASSIARLAHGVSGSAAYACATEVRRLARALEELSRAADLGPAADLLNSLRTECARCRRWVELNCQVEPSQTASGVIDASPGR